MVGVDLPGNEHKLRGWIGSDDESFRTQLPNQRRNDECAQTRAIEELEFIVVHVLLAVQVFDPNTGRIEIALALDDEELIGRGFPRDNIDFGARHRRVVQRDLLALSDLDLHADPRPEALHLKEPRRNDLKRIHAHNFMAGNPSASFVN